MKLLSLETFENVNKELDVNKANKKALLNIQNLLLEKFRENSITDKDLMKFFSKTYETIPTTIGAVRKQKYLYEKVLALNGINITIELSKKAESYYDKSSYYKKDDLIDICESLVNASDKFLVYSHWAGFNAMAELKDLKIEQIDFENKVINLKERDVKMDDYFYEVCKDVVNEKFYYKYFVDSYSEGSTSERYELNSKSPYVLKGKPTTKNQQGMLPLSVLRAKIRIIEFNDKFGMNLKPINIRKSRVLHDLDQIVKRDKKEVTLEVIEKYLKENKLRDSKKEIEILYNIVYMD